MIIVGTILIILGLILLGPMALAVTYIMPDSSGVQLFLMLLWWIILFNKLGQLRELEERRKAKVLAKAIVKEQNKNY